MSDKRVSIEEAVATIESGMTIGIGGWGSRRKPMALVREILRRDITDLTVVAFGGPDVGLLAAAGRIRRLIYGFVSLDSIPLDPLFTQARERGELEIEEYEWVIFTVNAALPFFGQFIRDVAPQAVRLLWTVDATLAQLNRRASGRDPTG